MRVDNWPLMIEVIRGIKNDPKSYYQGRYAKATPCGTAYCVAGHAIIRSGYNFLTECDGEIDDTLVIVPDADSPLYDESWFSAYSQVNVAPSEAAGAQLLGLDNWDAHDLFRANNTFGEILAMLQEWAHEDGVEWPADLSLTPEQYSIVLTATIDPRDEVDAELLADIERQLLGRSK